MNGFILDASVTLGWCFTDEEDPYASQVLASLASKQAIVPILWASEVSNALIVAERRKRLRPSDSTKFLELLEALPISFHSSQPKTQNLTHVARSFELSSYDATYLELAMRLGLSLATNDLNLLKAAGSAGVDHFDP